MSFTDVMEKEQICLMEGALGERLKREYHLTFDEHVDMAGLVYSEKGRAALGSLWHEYARIAARYALPFLATTPTRRTDRKRVEASVFDAALIKDNVDFLRKIQGETSQEMYIGGLLGCHGDAYTGADALDTEDAKTFHSWEVGLLHDQLCPP